MQVNGWTGGQYSLYRFALGLYLFVHFVQLVPWGAELFSNQGVLPDAAVSPLLPLFPNVLAVADGPTVVVALLVIASALAPAFALGVFDRAAAVILWYIWACLFGRNPLIANPGLPYVGWLLLAHAFLPAAPYGSWAARGRPDPGGSWRMPQTILVAAWVLMAVGYTYSGATKLVSPSWIDGTALARVLDNPLTRPGLSRTLLLSLPTGALQLMNWFVLGLELGFAPLSLVKKFRPWLWLMMLGMHLSLIVLIDFADLSLGLVMLHLFTFNPGWIPPRDRTARVRILYDGTCALCHALVRFVLSEDPRAAFRFAPLGGESSRPVLPGDQAGEPLPDSVVVTCGDLVLTRSSAVRLILAQLGGAWRVFELVLRSVPAGVLDRLYDLVAKNRYALFGRVPESCPLLPAELRERFDR